jgi:flagellin
MFSINTNNAALAALQSLGLTNANLTATQNAISTGKKVAAASDSPAIYSISQAMQGQISGLSAVSDSLNFGQSAVGTAISAAANISASLISLRQVVTDGSTSGFNATTLNNQINQVNALIAQYATAATFNGVNLLVGSTSANVSYTQLNVVQGINGAQLSVSNALSGAISGNSTAGTTPGDILSALGLVGLSVAAGGTGVSFSSDASIASGNTFVVYGTVADSTDTATTSSITLALHTWTFEFNAGTALGSTPSTSNTVVTVEMNSSSQNLTTSLGELVTSMNSQGFAASVNSSGLLVYTGNGSQGNTATASTITAGYGVTVNNNIGTTTTYTLTVNAASVALAAGSGSFTSTASSTGAISIVASAIGFMDTIAAYLGSASQQITGMQNFTTSLSDALTSGVGALIDADMTKESAQLTALQTKQSLAIQALSIANQQPQSLLTLFR